MRPLPRLHAITDSRVRMLDDFGVRAAAIAAAGPAVAIHARDRSATGAALSALAGRIAALVAPPEAQLAVNARGDIAAAYSARGIQLGAGDVSVEEARRVAPQCWIGVSVHSEAEARAAAAAGADLLLVGSVFETASHPGRRGSGTELVDRVARLGLPVVAIGGMNPERARLMREAGAWGVAAISALWGARDPAAAALAMLEPWMGD